MSAPVRSGALRPGQPFIFDMPCVRDNAPRYIVNFPTKRHWRDLSQHFADIESGSCRAHRPDRTSWVSASIAIPPLGCGLGGLDWAIAGCAARAFRMFARIPHVAVRLYLP